jgi:glutaredoxin
MITLTLLTKSDCSWCNDGRKILKELSLEFPLQIEEVSLESERGRRLATEHHLVFAPGLIADEHLIAHGRMSKRALRRDLIHLNETK